MPQSLAKIYLHLVFGVKDRRPFLDDAFRDDLHAYIAGVLKNLECHANLINSVKDHVHILFELSRTVAVSVVVENVKSSSSKWIKAQDRSLGGFAWQSGYGVFSVSESNAGKVRAYIANQQKHHLKQTFQDELRTLLAKHGVAFDERYVWD